MKPISLKAGLAVAVASLFAVGAAQAGDKVAGTISAGKLAKDAKNFYGQTVTVEAEVEDVLGGTMFTLDEDAILAGSDVLVLVPSGLTGTINRDQKVVVTGTVRKFVEQDLDRDFDWFDNGKLVQTRTKVDWQTRPVIVAHSIRTTSGTALMTASAAETMAATTGTTAHTGHTMATRTGITTDMRTITAGRLARDAKKYYGQTVTVTAEVEDVLGSNMFTLDEDSVLAGSDVLVLVPRGLAGTLNHDQKLVVTGKVRPFVEADLDRDFEWFDNGKLVDVKTKVDWKTRPVIVAETIRTDTGTEISIR